MFNIKYILKEPEPITVYTTALAPIAVGSERLHEVPSEVLLPGVYEIHDISGSAVLAGEGVTINNTPRLIGSVDSRIKPEVEISVGGDGPHAGKHYRVGFISNLRTHIECDLEDIGAPDGEV